MLVQAKILTREQLEEALATPREPSKKLGQVLIERGWLTEAQLTQTLSLQLSVPWVSLYHIDFSRQLLNRVSRDLAERYCLIPIFVRHVKGQGETLYVAMDDPSHATALAEVSKLAGMPARPMIASASDIRSAIRVYYGDPAPAPVLDVPVPPTRLEVPPTTTREGRARGEAPPTPPVPTQPDPPNVVRGSQPPRAPSQPPPRKPPVPSRPRSAPPPGFEGHDAPPPTTRSSPPPGQQGEAPPPERESEPGRRGRPKMVSLTLLDGTTIQLPARKSRAEPGEGLTARDFVSALRASAHGADASEILGEHPQWEPVVAALLSILLRKGLIADWEFVEELRKI